MKFQPCTPFCDVCGKHKGTGVNHERCARIRKKRTPAKPRSRLSRQQLQDGYAFLIRSLERSGSI